MVYSDMCPSQAQKLLSGLGLFFSGKNDAVGRLKQPYCLLC